MKKEIQKKNQFILTASNFLAMGETNIMVEMSVFCVPRTNSVGKMLIQLIRKNISGSKLILRSVFAY